MDYEHGDGDEENTAYCLKMMVMTHRRTINLRLLVPIFRVAKPDEAGEGKSWKFFLIIFIEK